MSCQEVIDFTEISLLFNGQKYSPIEFILTPTDNYFIEQTSGLQLVVDPNKGVVYQYIQKFTEPVVTFIDKDCEVKGNSNQIKICDTLIPDVKLQSLFINNDILPPIPDQVDSSIHKILSVLILSILLLFLFSNMAIIFINRKKYITIQNQQINLLK